jgi:hypothetical protein
MMRDKWLYGMMSIILPIYQLCTGAFSSEESRFKTVYTERAVLSCDGQLASFRTLSHRSPRQL